MVEGLACFSGEAEEIMDRVVKEAADPGGSDARGFGFEVENLTDHARFPEQPTVDPGAVSLYWPFKFREHGDTERTVGGDVLATAHLPGDGPNVTRPQVI